MLDMNDERLLLLCPACNLYIHIHIYIIWVYFIAAKVICSRVLHPICDVCLDVLLSVAPKPPLADGFLRSIRKLTFPAEEACKY